MYDVKKGYELAKEYYAQYGIDVDKMIEICDKTNKGVGLAWLDEVRKYEKEVLLNR